MEVSNPTRRARNVPHTQASPVGRNRMMPTKHVNWLNNLLTHRFLEMDGNKITFEKYKLMILLAFSMNLTIRSQIGRTIRTLASQKG
jgi:hypothetical protein